MKKSEINAITGRSLKRILKARNLKQNELAEMLSVKPTFINALVQGKKGMGKDLMARLCSVLTIRPYELYLEDTSPVPATELEYKALEMVRVAEKEHVPHVAEEAIEYSVHRIQRMRKQRKKKT